jgi:hypothetical protein
MLLFLLLAALTTARSKTAPITPNTSMDVYLSGLNISLENHYVTTADGYILHVHRLTNPGKPVVFLQHGILASSWCWYVSKNCQSSKKLFFKI